MMEDWTDIIGEELESFEAPLPADDWSVLQQKYAAAQRRKKAAAFAWAGGITSVAAAVALVFLLVRPDSSPVNSDPIGDLNDLVAETLPPTEEVAPVDSSHVESPIDTVLYVAPSVQKKAPVPVAVVKKTADDILIAENHTETPSSENTEVAVDVIRDTTSVKDKLLADASDFDAYPGMTIRGVSSLPRKGRLVSIGLSGSTSDSPAMMLFDMVTASPPKADSGSSEIPKEDEAPADSLGMGQPEPAMVMMKSKGSQFKDSYEHDLPVSVGVSASFRLTDRLSVNTGLNYTYYASQRKRLYYSTAQIVYDKQRVHYLGIPVRLDYKIVNRKYFNLYLGAGVQMDKCIYAKVDDERLHEKQFLFGVNGTMGMQVNIVQRVGLYFEPEFSYALNEGSIETFRSDEPFVVTVRGGLRFNF